MRLQHFFLAASLLIVPAFAQKKAKPAPAAAARPAEDRRGVHQAHQGVSAGPAHHHRTGGPHAGLRHRAFAAEILRPHSRHARRTDLRQGHQPLLRSARQGLPARQVLEDRPDRRRPRPGHPRHRRRSHHQGRSTSTRTCSPSSAIRARPPKSRPSELIHTAKPIYWVNSGIHSPETGGPEMLIELAYRLIVEETPVHPDHPQQRPSSSSRP